MGNAVEVELLQKSIGKLIDDVGLKLPNIIQIMFRHRYLPLQDRSSTMWAYKHEDQVTVRSFLQTDHDKMWRALFKPLDDDFPAEEEDRGLDSTTPACEVQNPRIFDFGCFHLIRVLMIPFSFIFAELG